MKNFRNLGTPLSKSEQKLIGGGLVGCISGGWGPGFITTFEGSAADELNWLEACHQNGGIGFAE